MKAPITIASTPSLTLDKSTTKDSYCGSFVEDQQNKYILVSLLKPPTVNELIPNQDIFGHDQTPSRMSIILARGGNHTDKCGNAWTKSMNDMSYQSKLHWMEEKGWSHNRIL